MFICPNCKMKYEGEGGFCEECGTKLEEISFCPQCGGEKAPDENLCKKCAAAAVAAAEAKEEIATIADTEKGKKKSLKWLALGGVAAAALLLVVAVVIAVVLLVGGKGDKSNNYGIYLKDRELYYTDYSEEGGKQLTAQFISASNNIADEGLAESKYTINSLMSVTSNGNRMFYPDEIDDSGAYTVYYRDLNKKRAEPVVAVENVAAYTINEDGSEMLYIKSKNRTLCYSNFKEEQEIAKDVEIVYTYNGVEKIIYKTYDGSLFLWYKGGESRKIASECEVSNAVGSVNWELNTVYYTKGNSLYRWKEEDNSTVKIGDDILRVICIYTTGEMYFVREQENTVSLMDYVYDDMAEYDAELEEPEEPQYPQKPIYPKLSNFKSMERYLAAVKEYPIKLEEYRFKLKEYNGKLAKYNKAYEEYEQKLFRDGIRESLKETIISEKTYSLCYFDGTKETVLTDELDNYSVRCSYNNAKAVFATEKKVNADKINFMELNNEQAIFEFQQKLNETVRENYAVSGGKVSEITAENATGFRVSTYGEYIAYIEDVTGENVGDLYMVTFEGDELGKAELVDKDVYGGNIGWTQTDRIAYYKNISTGSVFIGDYYIEGKLIAKDIVSNSMFRGDEVYYYTNWNEAKGCGTLNVYINNGDGNYMTFELADAVYEYGFTSDGGVRYLCNRNADNNCGELYVYNNGETVKVDDNVMLIIDPRNYTTRTIR